ncbi:MAG: 30S ribosomal protein S8 [Endozoicomonadaceae bacterium]|nr:30S ribosomal protein S8 [Endozoicomonadaceae bacterium]
MSMQDPLADMLTHIRNAQMARHESVVFNASKIKKAVSDVLKEEGYIKNYIVEGDVKKQIRISLKYYMGEPVIQKIKRISRPGLRNYVPLDKLPTINNGLGVAIISTSQGIMTDRSARLKKVGGEVLCTVF